MSTTRINNHMDRVLRLERPGVSPGGLVLPANAFNSRVVDIPPHKSAEIDFWDQVKNHPIYQSYLDRKKITTGDIDPRTGDGDPYTSFGDTMQAADSLNPDIDDNDAENDETKMKLERGAKDDKPRRGRPAKAAQTTPAEPEEE